MMFRSTTRKGFTLIELLVVIAIIAILAAILFPVFMKAKQAGNRAACLNNCRQIATAMLTYSESHNGRFPRTKDPVWGDVGTTPDKYMNQPWGRAYWAYALQKQLRNWNVFRCPDAPGDIHSPLVGYMLNPPDWRYTPAGCKGGQIHYGMNQFYAGEEAAVTAGMTPQPTRTALVADVYSAALFHDGDWDQNKGDLPGGMMRIKYANGPRSRADYDASKPYEGWRSRHGGPNVVFVDGHAAHIPENSVRFKRIAVNENGTMKEKYVEYPLINPDAIYYAPGVDL